MKQPLVGNQTPLDKIPSSQGDNRVQRKNNAILQSQNIATLNNEGKQPGVKQPSPVIPLHEVNK